MYCTDLDKTYLKTDTHVSPFSKRGWNRIVDAGIFITFATARGPIKSMSLLNGHKLKFPFIAANGAIIWSPTENTPLVINSLPHEDACLVVEIGKQNGCLPIVLSLLNSNEEQREYLKIENEGQKRFIEDKLKSHGAPTKVNSFSSHVNILIMNYIGRRTNLKELQNALMENIPNIEMKMVRDPYLDEYWSLEILHKNADKSHALNQLGDLGVLDLSKLIVFGDAENDIGMFKISSHGIAVANASNKLKCHASEILIFSNDEDAVIEYILKREFSE